MNLKHTVALLLIAVGGFFILTGAINLAVGLPGATQTQDTIASDVGRVFVWLGAGILVAGIAALVVGIGMYRQSDHRLPKGRPLLRPGYGPRFPLLSPMMVVLFLLTTALLGWTVIDHGFDWNKPRALRAYLEWGLLAALFLGAALCTLIPRRTAAPANRESVKPEASRNEESRGGAQDVKNQDG